MIAGPFSLTKCQLIDVVAFASALMALPSIKSGRVARSDKLTNILERSILVLSCRGAGYAAWNAD